MKTSRGFTLIELLVAMFIVAIMALLTISGAKRAVATAQLVSCAGNLRSLGEASLSFNAEHQYFTPWYTLQDSLYWWQELAPYVGTDNKVFRCPADKSFTFDDVGRTASYGWNYVLTGRGATPSDNPPAPDLVKVTTYSHPSTVLIAADGPGGSLSQQDDSWGFLDGSQAHSADPARHFGKANALFLDGHVERLNSGDLLTNPLYYNRALNL